MGRGHRPGRPPLRVVALGGGHGLAATLRALRTFCHDLTAVVTVADNGGSSGRLRRELGVLPPGDLRQALAALCRDDEWGRTWASVLQHRFESAGELHNHAVGNLLIVALWELLGGHVEGLDWVGRLLGAEGRVLPMAAVPLDIAAQVRGADPAGRGDVTIVPGPGRGRDDHGPGRVRRARADRPAGLPGGARGDRGGRLGGLGAGVVVHQCASAPARARSCSAHSCRARRKRCVTLNVAPQPGETDGFSRAPTWKYWPSMPRTCRSTSSLADASAVWSICRCWRRP